MFDSFIIGALTSLVFSLVVISVNFFRLKKLTNKQLIIRITISSLLVVFNLFLLIGGLISISSIQDISFTIVMAIFLVVIIILLIIIGRVLYKDISELLIRKNNIKKINQSKDIYLYEDNSNKDEKLSKENDTKSTGVSNESIVINSNQKNINLLRRLQIFVVSLMCIFVMFLILYPICCNNIFKKKLPNETEFTTIKLTNLDANEKVYHIMKENYNYIYVNKNNDIVLYRFKNSSMYSSSNVVRTGYATSLEIKKYFEDKLISGYPTISSFMPEIIPIGVIIGSLFIISITLFIFYIHRISHEIIFKLGQNHKVFKRIKDDYKNEVISKYDYIKLNKRYFSQLIMKNNAIMSLFKIFY